MRKIQNEYGISTNEAESWNDFLHFVNEYLEFNHFIWRGQADSSWLLEPTLDRVFKETKVAASEAQKLILMGSHLERFKFATRGRRGANPPNIINENDWWALGQHNGLSTPLLDWTSSPFAAAYFAQISKQISTTGFRVIYGISQSTIEKISIKISQKHGGAKRPAIIEFISPLSDENTRLVNQRGLFTRAPIGKDIESWYKNNFPKGDKYIRMWKILIPEKERVTSLRSLNRMNINHSTLFPDLYGASKFVNLDLEIDKY